MPTPLPILLWCPLCHQRHVDVGEFAVKPHHTHACQGCGHVWRPAIEPTVGVQFLPGFKDAAEVEPPKTASAEPATVTFMRKLDQYICCEHAKSWTIRQEVSDISTYRYYISTIPNLNHMQCFDIRRLAYEILPANLSVQFVFDGKPPMPRLSDEALS